MKIFVIDTETTGLDPATDSVVQIAAAVVEVGATGVEPLGIAGSSFVNPHRPIPPESSAVHHILDRDVAEAPSLPEALERVLGLMWPTSVEYVAAHNCRFDMGFLPMLKEGRKWIDTYRCAMHVWPDAPNFKNWTLCYWLGDGARGGFANPHSADADASATAYVLCALLRERSVDELLKLSTKAAVLRKVGFGKHFGALWTDVPTSYLDWASTQKDMDPDVKFTVKHELAQRAASDAHALQPTPASEGRTQ